ncbi:MAG TPA: hypothetical protein VJJ82_02560 [Candidatus Nanoarchaeia archaeon]|nr:hypothetical protein [Candidatus Nanoarchaeia archaeon]
MTFRDYYCAKCNRTYEKNTTGWPPPTFTCPNDGNELELKVGKFAIGGKSNTPHSGCESLPCIEIKGVKHYFYVRPASENPPSDTITLGPGETCFKRFGNTIIVITNNPSNPNQN